MASVPCVRRSPLLRLVGVVTTLSGASWAFARRPSLLRPSSRGNAGNAGNALTPQQLTGRLKAAETSNHLLFLVEQYENVLNEYHVRAALTRLAQSNETTTLSGDPGFRKLLSRTSELMTTFRSQALATVLWSLAKVEYDPGEPFLRSVIDASLPQLKQSKPQEMVNSLWACARFGYQPGYAFLEALVDTSSSTMDDFEPMDVANLLWSFARLGFHPGNHFLDAVVARSLEIVQSFAPVDIANILWAFAKLKVDEGERLRPLLQQAEEQLDSYLGLRIRSRPRGMRSLVHGTKDNGGNMGFSWEHDFSTNMLKMPRHAPFYGYIHAEGDQPTLSMRFWGTLGLDFHMLNWPVRHVVDGSWMPFLGCCEFIGSPFFRRSGDFFSFRTGIL